MYFYQVVNEVKKDLDSIGIPYDRFVPIELNKRLTKTLGVCKYRGYFGDKKAIVIEISSKVLESYGKDALKSVIAHELIHSCKDCVDDHHGPRWTGYAQKVNELLGNKGYYVSRLYSVKAEEAKKVYKYTVVCDGCGCENYYAKKSTVVKHALEDTGRITCNRCGSNHFSVKVNY